jgi:hypothetical protein
MSRTGGFFGSLSLADIPGLEQIRGGGRRRTSTTATTLDGEEAERNLLHTQIVVGSALLTLLFASLIYFVLEVGTVANVAFFFPLITAPAAILQRWKIHYLAGKGAFSVAVSIRTFLNSSLLSNLFYLPL